MVHHRAGLGVAGDVADGEAVLDDVVAAAEAAQHYLESVAYKTIDTGSLADYSNYLFNLHYLKEPQDFMLEAAKNIALRLELPKMIISSVLTPIISEKSFFASGIPSGTP